MAETFDQHEAEHQRQRPFGSDMQITAEAVVIRNGQIVDEQPADSTLPASSMED